MPWPATARTARNIWQTLDARVEKSFKLGRTPEVAVFGDFLNLFNSDANESVLDRRLGNSNYLVPSRFILPRRLMVGAQVPVLERQTSTTARVADTLGPGQ